MKLKIKIGDALKILENSYLKKYNKYENIKVEYGKTLKSYSRSDWGEGLSIGHCYELCAVITYNVKLGEVMASGDIKKDCWQLEKDLIDELNNNYLDDEVEVDRICFHHDYCSENIDYDGAVVIELKDKSKRLIKK